jgi:hypothetical protein
MTDTTKDAALLTGDKCSCGRPVPLAFRQANRNKTITCSACKARWKIPTEIAAPITATPAAVTAVAQGAAGPVLVVTVPEPTPKLPPASVEAARLVEQARQVGEEIAARDAGKPSVFVEQRNPVQLLNDKCVVIQTSYPAPGTERKLNQGEVRIEATGEGGSPDQSRMRALKTLWKCPEYSAIKTHDGQTQRRIDRLALPQSDLVREGSRVVLLTDVEKIIKTLDEEDAPKRAELIEEFVKVYPALIEAAKKSEAEGGLGALFSERDFPAPGAEIRRCFLASNGKAIYRRIRMATDSTPASLAAVSEELLRKELAESMSEGTGLVMQLRDGLRYAFAELVTGITARLKTSVGEPAKGFKEANLLKLKSFVDDFLAVGDASRNVTSDDTLKRLAERARALLSGVDVKDIREKTSVKNAFEGAVGAIKAELDQLVTLKPGRKYGGA